MVKTRFEAHWFFDAPIGSLCYMEGGYHEPGTIWKKKPSIVIPRGAYFDLLDYLREHEKGVVKTDRVEDLKITHRLLDLLEKEKKT